LLCRDTERLQRMFQILYERCRLRPRATRKPRLLNRRYYYFFFFEVFFAVFLVADLAVFFAFFAFLAMCSSVKNQLSEHAHAVYQHAQHENDITKSELIPTSRDVALESLAGGSRSRVPPSAARC
jgi:hypothetical protein